MADPGTDTSSSVSSLNSTLMQQAVPTFAQSQAQKQEERKVIRENILPELSEQSSRRLPPLPQAPPTEPPPKPQYTDPMQPWGSLAMGVAMLGSAFTRQPLVNALNAGAAVNNAFHRNDIEASKQSLETWRAQTDYAQKLYEYQDKTYRDALLGLKDDRAGTMAKLRALSVGYQDNALAELLKMGQLDQALTHITEVVPKQVENLNARTTEAQTSAELNVQKLQFAQQENEIRTQMQAATAAGNQPEVDRLSGELRAVQGKAVAGAGGGLAVSKSFDIVDEKGQVVESGVMARERRDKPGFIYSEGEHQGEEIKLPPGQRLKPITPSQTGGGRAGAQVLRQQIGGREVLSDLQNAVSLPVGTTIGPLGTVHPGTSVLGALQGDLVRQLTDQDSQLMQASMAGVTRELSILMSPVYGGNYATQQLDPLIPKSGDSLGTAIFKLARLAQSADNALEGVSKSPIVSNDQKQYAVDMRDQIQQAIPWTTKQAMDFARQGHAVKESFGEFVKKNVTPSAGVSGEYSKSTIDDLLNAINDRNLTNDQRRAIAARLEELGH
jgi:hypothetical protein